MVNLLAEVGVGASDTLISGNWIIGMIGALFTGAALLLGKHQGKKQEQDRKVTINDPIPKVRTQEEPEYVTNEILNGHLARIDGSIREIKQAQDSERGVARTAISNVHSRLDKVIENQGVSRGELTQINLNVQRLLNRTDSKPRA